MKRLFIAAVLAALGFSTAPRPAGAAEAEHLKIDATQSKFAVHVGRSGFLKMFGHDHNIAIKEFGGTAQFTPSTIEPAALEMTIKANSLAVTDNVSASDKAKIEQTMKETALEVVKYPNIVFKSSKITVAKMENGHGTAHILGDVTLHGVTKPLSFDGALEIGEHRLRASGAFFLKQSDFGIKPVSVAGGSVKVKDQLKFTFDIVAH